jgi:hypothetical protein
MNLPEVLADLVAAQNSSDSVAYQTVFLKQQSCLTKEKAHNATMRALDCSASRQTLAAEIAGTFPGNLLLTYEKDLRSALEINQVVISQACLWLTPLVFGSDNNEPLGVQSFPESEKVQFKAKSVS